ncbi:MAG TPA: histidine kinase dimerization/phospho-acceptor domain-containing protein, partial [Burkholderiales bacterium]|nr:histidine kinase dimerization/phospho-acceptor domain-containing protein [Burkholderiales bacterium]
MTLRKHLALLAIGMLLPILALSAVAMMTLMQAERKAAERSVQETARTIALSVDREIAAAEAAMRVLAISPMLARGNMAYFYELAKNARTDENAWILLCDSDGRQLINTRVPYGAALPRRAELELVRTVVRTQRTHVSDLFTGALTQRLVLSIDVPVPLGDGQRYVLTQSFFPDHFDEVLRERPLPDGWVAAINDRQGRTITRSTRAQEFVGEPISPALQKATTANAEGSLTHLGRDGHMLFDYYTRSTESGWLVVVGVPVAVLNAPARRAGLIAGLGLAGTLGILAGIAFFFAQRLSRSIGAAARTAARMGHAQSPAAPPRSSIDELRALHAALGTAARDLDVQRAARTLAECERERLFEAEQKARKEAEAQSRAKDQFLAMLGHELRNPLAAVSNAIQIIERGTPDTRAVSFAHEVIGRQTRQLSHLLDDLLDVSRVLIGKIELKREPLDLAAAVEAGVHTVCAAGHVKSSVLKTDFEKVYVSGDSARL